MTTHNESENNDSQKEDSQVKHNGGSPKALGSANEEILEALSGILKEEPHRADDFLSSSELAEHLFAKAPAEFIQGRSSDELVDICRTLKEQIDSFANSEERFSVSLMQNGERQSGEKLGLSVLIGDRPFVVNTVRERILQQEYIIETYLHPIIVNDSQRISCSYIEITGINNAEAEVLKQQLERSLSHLLLTTDDFTSMLVQIETLARVLESKRSEALYSAKERKEAIHLLRWISDGGFIFTGLTVWEEFEDYPDNLTPKNSFGVHKLDTRYGVHLQHELREDITSGEESENLISVSRTRSESLIQRCSRLLNITIRERSTDGQAVICHQITGMLTSKALAEESSSIPVLRLKLKEVLELESAHEQSHDFKNIINIFNSMPKEEAFRLDIQNLRSVIHTILDIQNRNETSVSVRYDNSHRNASVLIVMPRDRFNTAIRNTVQNHIEKTFHAVPGASEYFLDLSSKQHARLYFYVPLQDGDTPSVDHAALKAEIAQLTRGWLESLRDRIFHSGNFEAPHDVWEKYGQAFEDEYQTLQSIEECETDLLNFKRLTSDAPIQLGKCSSERPIPGSFILVVYKYGENFTISHALPILENAGLEVLGERNFRVKPFKGQKIAIHRFRVRPRSVPLLSDEAFEKYLAPGLQDVFLEKANDDTLNSLFITANLTTQEIDLLRSYCSLLWQVDKFASVGVILQTLATIPEAAKKLWEIFNIRFNPELQNFSDSREEEFKKANREFHERLRNVSDITKNRILRNLALLIKHTTRTNYFLSPSSIALKIRSIDVDIMPQPRPLYEIFISGKRLRGVHLRNAEIARGGLRWSDRDQDFRHEVLDLVKTQNFKNALIVPGGAKGGFVVRDLPEDSSDQRSAVELAYKEFIRGLLSITDNRVGDKVVHPENVIPYDGEDPYLVVAADKGTATFSDIANNVAENEFNFWLGDAFASGGSDGYDHKLYGITARGAWESVKRHFNNIGIDYINDSFTVIGVGDMSGDVFGNGLLLSDKALLVGAFNHKHIFIDPKPDLEAGFAERKRLFELPRSQWSDFNRDVISEGGGVFLRSDREIELTPQMREALDIPSDVPDVVDGEQLISLLLKAPTDLLWNGGIGTYVKAQQESHSDVNDRTNDRVRVDADDLRVQVVGEGGNLGLTQLARIEFARRGGHINTDAIDNSAGVDLSDHEVNLKILFQDLIAKGLVTKEERNVLLKEIANEVTERVLTHNQDHALLLTIAVRRSRKNIDYFQSLLHELYRMGLIDRRREQLPSDEELQNRQRRKEGLCKPELALCLAAVKMWMRKEIEASPLSSDPLLQPFLIDYFPKKIRENYRESIIEHPLAHQIISNETTNKIVDTLGITFIHRMSLLHTATPLTVAKCALAADLILGAREVRQEIRKLDTPQHSKVFLSLLEDLNEVLRELTAWFINYCSHMPLRDIVSLYGDGFRKLIDLGDEVLSPTLGEVFKVRREKYKHLGLDENFSQVFACFPHILLIQEILWTAHKLEKPTVEVAENFMAIMELLRINEIIMMGQKIEPRSKWEAELLIGALRDIRRGTALTTFNLMDKGIETKEEITDYLSQGDLPGEIKKKFSSLRASSQGVVEIAVMAGQLLLLAKRLGS